MDEWILNIANNESFDYNTEAYVGKAISKSMKRNQNANAFTVVE